MVCLKTYHHNLFSFLLITTLPHVRQIISHCYIIPIQLHSFLTAVKPTNLLVFSVPQSTLHFPLCVHSPASLPTAENRDVPPGRPERRLGVFAALTSPFQLSHRAGDERGVWWDLSNRTPAPWSCLPLCMYSP